MLTRPVLCCTARYADNLQERVVVVNASVALEHGHPNYTSVDGNDTLAVNVISYARPLPPPLVSHNGGKADVVDLVAPYRTPCVRTREGGRRCGLGHPLPHLSRRTMGKRLALCTWSNLTTRQLVCQPRPPFSLVLY